jgi:hypothetical protein
MACSIANSKSSATMDARSALFAAFAAGRGVTHGDKLFYRITMVVFIRKCRGDVSVTPRLHC